MALTLDQVKATGIPLNISKLDNRALTPSAVKNKSVNLFDAISLVIGASGLGTDLSITQNIATTTVNSSTGADVTIPAATTLLSGVMTGTDKVNLAALSTLSGVAVGATNLGTFTGTTITDNSTVKTALQELETSVEAIDTVYTADGTVVTDRVVSHDNRHLQFINAGASGRFYVYETQSGGLPQTEFSVQSGFASLVHVSSASEQFGFSVSSFGISLINTGATNYAVTGRPMDYGGDYSANYSTRSLVDKAYVDAAITAGADGDGIYDGSGTVPASTTVTIDDGITFNTSAGTTPFQVTFGTTTGSALVMDNANALLQYFDAGGTNKVHCKSDGILLQTASPDQVTIQGKAAEYSADYSGGYTDRSLVDKAYVDGKIIAYTPTSSADGAGSTGDVAYDDNYIYVKTSGNGWCRAAISTF